MSEDFKTGDVFDYPYLWSWQYERGETEGRKERPCCVALVVPLSNGHHSIYILPITTKRPTDTQFYVQIPRMEIQRAGLNRDMEQWVIMSEWNRDILETSFYMADGVSNGSFSKKFMDQVLTTLKKMLNAENISVVKRN